MSQEKAEKRKLQFSQQLLIWKQKLLELIIESIGMYSGCGLRSSVRGGCR